MTALKERVTLLVSKSKKKDLLALLKAVDFVEVETREQQLDRFIENAPTEPPLTEDDIQREITAHRAEKASASNRL